MVGTFFTFSQISPKIFTIEINFELTRQGRGILPLQTLLLSYVVTSLVATEYGVNDQGRRSGYESGGGGRQPREKFWRAKRGATERSEPTSEGGSGGPPLENFENLHGKWCNLRYS